MFLIVVTGVLAAQTVTGETYDECSSVGGSPGCVPRSPWTTSPVPTSSWGRRREPDVLMTEHSSFSWSGVTRTSETFVNAFIFLCRN